MVGPEPELPQSLEKTRDPLINLHPGGQRDLFVNAHGRKLDAPPDNEIGLPRVRPRDPHGRWEIVSMRLPKSLQDPDDHRALAALTRYYGQAPAEHSSPFTGARFDTWDSTGTRHADRHRFTADDLVAVTFLSVHVPAQAAVRLLDTQAAHFADLLEQLGEDRDLVEEREPWSDDWSGWILWRELDALPGVGPTIASKLLARKRPRLRPIYDTVVAGVLGSQLLWEPLRAHLAADPELHGRLLRLRDQANLPAAVSALRVFDVVTWMEGKYGAA